MGDTRTFKHKVKTATNEDSWDYFIKLFPERKAEIMKWSESFADEARKSASSAVIDSAASMELAYNEHDAFMQEQYKTYGACSVTAELEHIQNVDKAVKGDGTLDSLYGKMVNEATREAIVRRVFT